ncbi:hypothetical protein TNCV_4940611 [Trichonephila clavipes]|nr:hypothetical protein TNCV_4940611 [Trichonephila clavipes]
MLEKQSHVFSSEDETGHLHDDEVCTPDIPNTIFKGEGEDLGEGEDNYEEESEMSKDQMDGSWIKDLSLYLVESLMRSIL